MRWQNVWIVSQILRGCKVDVLFGFLNENIYMIMLLYPHVNKGIK